MVDVKRRKLHPVGLLDFAVYLSFFPHLLAGPIVRASEFLPADPAAHRSPPDVEAGRALWLISRGLFKKVVIASYLATHGADPLFAVPARHAGFEALFGVYAYAIQIYADFSGYTDIAIGLALLLGIRFPQNFDSPYRSLSLQEFWRRWHMTLSRFLRDYLYIPLGGKPRGTAAHLRQPDGAPCCSAACGTARPGPSWRGGPCTAAVWPSSGPGSGTAAGPCWPGCGGDPAGHAGHLGRVSRARASGAPTGRPGRRMPRPWRPLARVAPAARGWTSRVAAWAITFNFVCLGWIFFRAYILRQRRPGAQADLHHRPPRRP